MKTRTFDTFMQGVAIGVLGFLTVAIVFAVANLVVGRSPFYTAALLGASLFYGVTDPSQMAPTIAPYVFAFNGAHLCAFVVLGVVASWLIAIAERGAMLWYPALFFFIFVAFHMMGAAQLMAMPLRELIPPFSIWAAGILAAIVMGYAMLWLHPVVRGQLAGWRE